MLAAYGVTAERLRYLDDPPSRNEILHVLSLLKADDPKVMMRTKEPRFADEELADATPDELIDAMTKWPELIERPIVIREERAIIARPPELLLKLL